MEKLPTQRRKTKGAVDRRATLGRAGAAGGLDCFYRPSSMPGALVVGHSSLLASQVPRPSLPSTRVISAGAGQSRRRWRRQAGICPTHCVPSLFLNSIVTTPPLFQKVPSLLLSWQEGSPRVRHLCGQFDGRYLQVLMALLLQSSVCSSVSTLDTRYWTAGTKGQKGHDPTRTLQAS